MDDETIDLAARLGAEGVGELRSLHDKASRLALMIHDKLALPGVTHLPTDGIGVVVLGGDMCVTVFAPRVIEVVQGVEAQFNRSCDGAPLAALVSRELERALGPVNRINPESFTVVFEGETFVVDVWLNADEVDVVPGVYDYYGADYVCFCELVDRRPADVTTKEGA